MIRVITNTVKRLKPDFEESECQEMARAIFNDLVKHGWALVHYAFDE